MFKNFRSTRVNVFVCVTQKAVSQCEQNTSHFKERNAFPYMMNYYFIIISSQDHVHSDVKVTL